MVRNLLTMRPEESRQKVLLLGISYPSVPGVIEKHKFDPDILNHKTPSIDQSIEVVRRGILTEMDGRDLARCVATEQACNVDVYSCSKEIGAVYRDDRHVHANFNGRNFCKTLRDAFGEDVQFSQVILDYYWMPTGWLVTRWARTLFQNTLPDLVRKNMLTFPSKRSARSRRNQTKALFEEGVVYLPFCAHVCKELVGAIDTLEEFYAISFVKKQDLAGHSLWKGTMTIDPDDMQQRLGKRLDQEEVYCHFRPKDIHESMEDSHVSKPAVMRILLAIEDYENIRMIRLRPLRQHEPPSVMKERMLKPEIGGFKGLNFELVKIRKKEMEEKKKQEVLERKKQLAKEKQKEVEEKQKVKAQKVEERKELARKRKLEKLEQKSGSPKKKARIPKKEARDVGYYMYDSDDVYDPDEQEEEAPLSFYTETFDTTKLPPITYYYPGPSIDLNTFFREKEEKPKATFRRKGERRKEEEKEKPRESVGWTLNGETVWNRVVKRSTRRSILAGSLDLTDVRPPVIEEEEEEETPPHEYLSFNPRCFGMREKYPVSKEPGSAVLDLEIPEENFRPNHEVQGARALFDIRNDSLQGVWREFDKAPTELTCYKIPTKAIVRRNQRWDKQQDPEDYLHFYTSPATLEAAKAYRGDWDECHLLHREDKKGLRLLKQKYIDVKENYQKQWPEKAAGMQEIDRWNNVCNIFRWFLFDRHESFDPAGILCEIESNLQPKLSECGYFWQRAKLIEEKLNKDLKVLLTKKSLSKSSKGSKLGQLLKNFVEDHKVAWTVDDLKNSTEGAEEYKLYQDALEWLKDKKDKKDPTKEFREINGKIPADERGENKDSRAREMASRILFLRDVMGDWLDQKSKRTTPVKKSKYATKPIPKSAGKTKKVNTRENLKEKAVSRRTRKSKLQEVVDPLTMLANVAENRDEDEAAPIQKGGGAGGVTKNLKKKASESDKPKTSVSNAAKKKTPVSRKAKKAVSKKSKVKQVVDPVTFVPDAFSESSEQDVKAAAKQKASIGRDYAKTVTKKAPKTDKLKIKISTKKAPNTDKLITNTLAKKAPESPALKTPGSSEGAVSPSLIQKSAAARETQFRLDNVYPPQYQETVQGIRVDFFDKVGMSKDSYESFIAEYASSVGKSRAMTLHSILLWLSNRDPRLDPLGDFEFLSTLTPATPNSSLSSRGLELEMVLNLLPRVYGENWKVHLSQEAVHLSQEAVHVQQATELVRKRLGQVLTEALVQVSVDRWRNVQFCDLQAQMTRLLSQHQPVCVSPSPPTSVYEGWARERVVAGPAVHQMQPPVTMPIRHAAPNPQFGHLEWVPTFQRR